MKQRSKYVGLGVVGALGVTAATYFFRDRNKQVTDHYLENAGKPDQTSYVSDTQLENAKMVSEGSQFGIHYYNKQKEN